MSFINLTQHLISVEKTNGEILTIEPSGIVARLATTPKTVEIDGFNFSTTQYGEVEFFKEGVQLPSFDLSEQACACSDCTGHTNTAQDRCFADVKYFYICSAMVAEKLKLGNVVSPDSGKTAERDDQGQIKFVRGFIKY